MIIPVVLAGGSGTRLWPLSRQHYPKQLLKLFGDTTMLQQTILRLSGLADLASPIVVCNVEHRFMVAEQLHEIGLTDAIFAMLMSFQELLARQNLRCLGCLGSLH